jgi:hypothetical protein
MVKNQEIMIFFLAKTKDFSIRLIPALGLTQPPIQWVPWALPLGEAAEAGRGKEADYTPQAEKNVKL